MCLDCGWSEVLDVWQVHYRDARFKWCQQTIVNICKVIRDRGHVTERQRASLARIKDAALNPPSRFLK